LVKQEQFTSILFWEFDPGSGWTLAACLKHASRTEICRKMKISGGRVSISKERTLNYRIARRKTG